MAEQLEQAFKVYFDEIDRCISSNCYWALLHIVVALPDICAALESDDGETDPGRYRSWCKRYLAHTLLSAEDHYEMRCILLHQGRTTTTRGRYSSYSFIRPSSAGIDIHRLVVNADKNITLNIRRMAEDTRHGICQWFADLQRTENSRQLQNVQRYLPRLAKEGPKVIPGIGGVDFWVLSST